MIPFGDPLLGGKWITHGNWSYHSGGSPRHRTELEVHFVWLESEPECKECCLGAGASEYDFDTIDDDDGEQLCTCIKPTR